MPPGSLACLPALPAGGLSLLCEPAIPVEGDAVPTNSKVAFIDPFCLTDACMMLDTGLV